MKYIQKTNEPTEFIAWKQSHNTNIQGIGNDAKTLWNYWGANSGDVKKTLTNKLSTDQGHVCCYCNQRIPAEDNDRTEIEHLIPKTQDTQSLTFDFNNLLLSCHGDRNTKQMHCNAKKDNNVLPITPLMPDCHEHFIFTRGGEIKGTNDDAIKTVSLLGLFFSKLKIMRKTAIDRVLATITSREEAEKTVIALQNETAPFTPFSVAIIYILKDEFGI